MTSATRIGTLVFFGILVLGVAATVASRSATKQSVKSQQITSPDIRGTASVESYVAPSRPVKSRDSAQRQFDTASNLSALVTTLQADADAGDGHVARIIGDAYAECLPFGADPLAQIQATEKTLSSVIKPEMESYFKRAATLEASRCGALNQRGPQPENVSEWYRNAAEHGDLAAQVRTTNVRSAPTEMQGLADKAIAAKDGDAMNAIGSALAQVTDSARGQLAENLSDPNARYAWKLAACSFQVDCGADSQEVRAICLRSGLCGFGTLAQAYQSFLSPVEFQQAQALSRAIVASANSGAH